MKIQRLDIQGFKSFADRTSIRFGQGITGVVGPNGCGKSNIVDAIRWAMGEQSARLLRGGSMQDVIFNGSEVRGPMGMAEVTLAFDNDGAGHMPPEYAHISEIQVTRRLYRDGDSEYEINKTPCRLKDVHDLFLGSGVGTRAYSIINQGQVAEIMRVKPEERRRIIEEAAGITKYKARKEQASRKMEATRVNLTRIDDVTKEIGRRLGSLRRQAKKAEKYQDLKTQVRGIELHLSTLRFFELSNAAAFDRAQHEALQEGMKGELERYATVEAAIDELRKSQLDDERALNEKQGRLYEIDAGLALNQQSADHAKTTYERSMQRDQEAAVEVERLREQRAMVEGIRQELEKTQRDLFSEAQQDEGALDVAVADLESHRSRRGDEAKTVETLRKQVIETSTSAAKLGSDVHNLRRSLEDMEKRKEVIALERAPLVDELLRLDEQVTLHDTERATVETDKQAAEEERKTANEQMAEDKKALHAAQRTHDEARADLQKKRSRLSSLEEIHARYEQSPESVRALLKRGGPLEGRGKLLVDLFEAQPEWEATIEAGLGARLQSVVVDGDDEARAAIEFLREGKAKGRAELLVESAQPEASTGTIEGATRALDVVKLGKKAGATAKAILSRLFLVEDLAAASSSWAAARAIGATLVTRNGDVFEPGGNIRGGVVDKEGQGVLKQKREMRELADDVATREALLHELNKSVEEKQEALLVLDETLQRASERAQSLSLKLVEVKGVWKRALDEQLRLKQRSERLTLDEEKLTDALKKAAVDVDEKSVKLREAESSRAAFEAELSSRGQTLVELDQTIAAKQDVVTTMKVRAASIAERTGSLKKNLEQQQAQARDLESRLTRLQKQIEDGHVERELLTKTEADARGLLAVLGDERVTVKSSLEAMRATWEKKSEDLRFQEHEARAARAALDAARETHTGLQVRIRERELELDAIIDRTIERHRVTPHEVLYDFHMLPLPSTDALQDMADRLQELERQIEGLGNINLTAIDECKELEKRHDFLRTQADDLTHALNQLEKAIIKINRTTKKRFQETFEGINERFTQVFPRLFRGGKAWLALTDPNDMLTTGVEIYAQPPGKKLGSVALMSGGEQALTAVSLLFAIFLLKPSPFCLLDEVDAPLDEANVGRFNDMVKDVSSLSQFIVITHNKKTMEVADQLYGITMEEPGISKTVNVRIQ
ncbi:MAG: chromosome segregation protein SMC [Deltaproteobacteria bacterium]|nr:chromosome segregation protein SMC [Deltaproteobacteria bacterium]